MRVTKQVTKTTTVEELQDILCNKCGKSCKDSSDMNYEGLIEATVHGGYGSSVVGDLTSWRFSVCEHCLGEFVDTFKIRPEIGGMFASDPDVEDEGEVTEEEDPLANVSDEVVQSCFSPEEQDDA